MTAWTNTDGGSYWMLGVDGLVRPAADDLAANLGAESTQEFRLQSRFANSVPIAPSAVRVDADTRLLQRPDGSVVAETIYRSVTDDSWKMRYAVNSQAILTARRCQPNQAAPLLISAFK